MKRLLASSLLALSMAAGSSATSAAEGRVAAGTPAPLEAGRVANYTGRRTNTVAVDKQYVAHASGKMTARGILHAKTEALSARASHIYIYDADSVLLRDRDGDAHHSEFRIRFDADSNVGDVLVHARLYLRRVGDPDWLLYYITDDFWVYGRSGDDDYFVTTTLDDGFPTGEYDVLIDLYESGFSGIVDTIGPQESGALSLLPLEEARLDLPIELPGYSIPDVSTTLIVDSDGDGHYSKFRISFDPDADFDGTLIYAVFWVRAQGGTWTREHVSEDFPVDSGGTDDAYSLTAEWVSDYPTAFYDVQIDLHDAATDALVASAGSERPELSRVPLEDQFRDRFVSPPTSEEPGDSTSRERGGGAMAVWWLLGLLLLLIGRHGAAMKRQFMKAWVALK